MSCLVAGFSGAGVDMAAAIPVAVAMGCPAATAAVFLAAFQGGMWAGQAEMKDAGP